MSAVCTGFQCGKPIDMRPGRKTTLCRACSNAQTARSPLRRAAAAAQMRELHADPDRSRSRIEKAAARLRERIAADPAFRQRLVEQGRKLGTSHSAAMKLLPVEYHAEYKRLAAWHLSAQERLALVQDQIRADKRRAGAHDL